MLFAVFDTETTGLPSHREADLNLQPRVIEFAGLITDGKDILSTEEFICNPGIAIEQVITDITGLNNADLEDKPPFSAFLDRLAAYFCNAAGRIAHNLSFDKSMLHYDLTRLGLDLSRISWQSTVDGTPCVEICTVEQLFHQEGKRIRLQDWNERNFGPYKQKHRALDDVILLHENCKKEGIYDAFL
jgi:DNA polymerase III alpha subunit (gram-positive type)